ncbi:hypothetical protein FSP39_015340 [Pinctada imbricata]|uniref:Major facilitator superfamily (MFS) profile domain-containing protein n=1 Tax=Pinctada imbricata TaxID=66713 RepID=A0AA88YF71_PINIB|nr:hypothetical protein FSP39_015340 [Pinctada imbricata]
MLNYCPTSILGDNLSTSRDTWTVVKINIKEVPNSSSVSKSRSVVFGSSYAACGGSIIPSLLISLKGKDQLSLTYGVTLANFAIGQLLGAPAAGWIYDLYGSYSIPFFVAGAAMMISALIMIVPYRSSSFAPQNEETTVTEQVTSTNEQDITIATIG